MLRQATKLLQLRILSFLPVTAALIFGAFALESHGFSSPQSSDPDGSSSEFDAGSAPDLPGPNTDAGSQGDDWLNGFMNEDDGYQTIPAPSTAIAGGWTVLTPSADSRIVYVSSSSGSNANDGLSASTPKASIAAGKALLRLGFPDWMLLKTGDTWDESLGQWKVSGRSATEPMVVSSYGTSPLRPLLRTGTDNGIITDGGGGSPQRIDYLSVVGLHFIANGYTGSGVPSGFVFLLPTTDLLIEDCRIEGYCNNVTMQGGSAPSMHLANISIRRSLILDAYNTGSGNPQGIFCAWVDGLLLEENVIDHNGWSETVPGAIANIFRHNVYIDDSCTGVTVNGNIIANASSHGTQLRHGGVVTDNLFLRNSISLSLGGGASPDPNGINVDVRRNVILDGKDIDAQNPRGWGIVLSNVASGTVANNIIANQTLAHYPIMLDIVGDQWGWGVYNTLIEKNIFSNWGGSVTLNGSSSNLSTLTFRQNDLQDTVTQGALIDHNNSSSTAAIHSSGNRFYSQNAPAGSWTQIGQQNYSLTAWKSAVGDTTSFIGQAGYPLPNSGIGSYNAWLGGSASHYAFMAQARRQSKATWDPAYMAVSANRYMRRALSH